MPDLIIYCINLFAHTYHLPFIMLSLSSCQATGPWFIFLEPSKQTAPRIYTEDETKREKFLLLRNTEKTDQQEDRLHEITDQIKLNYYTVLCNCNDTMCF